MKEIITTLTPINCHKIDQRLLRQLDMVFNLAQNLKYQLFKLSLTLYFG